MKYLGPLSSDLGGGTRLFYVDMSNQLDTSERLNTIAITTSDSDLVITIAQITATDIVTKDNHTLPAYKTVAFRATCSTVKTKMVTLTIDYNTTQSNADSTKVLVKIVPTLF